MTKMIDYTHSQTTVFGEKEKLDKGLEGLGRECTMTKKMSVTIEKQSICLVVASDSSVSIDSNSVNPSQGSHRLAVFILSYRPQKSYARRIPRLRGHTSVVVCARGEARKVSDGDCDSE
jgi:hypothetical protein